MPDTPIVLFTDFGPDLYVGQVKSVLLAQAPHAPVIDLLHDAPAFDIAASAHLLAACLPRLPQPAVVVAVVDPGVGTARDAVVVSCDGRHLVGPDNGLMSVCAARSKAVEYWTITWRPTPLSMSFHGRDLFAPIAAAIAPGPWPEARLAAKPCLDVAWGAGDRRAVIYFDRYGNACTGLRAAGLPADAVLSIGGRRIAHQPVFGAAREGEVFWYENSLGLVEIAANRANARELLRLGIGDPITTG